MPAMHPMLNTRASAVESQKPVTRLALAMSAGCPFVTADRRFYDALRGTAWEGHCLWVEDVS